jgi:hypothetical protein
VPSSRAKERTNASLSTLPSAYLASTKRSDCQNDVSPARILRRNQAARRGPTCIWRADRALSQ